MTKSIPTTEQAKIIRKVLREAFPQTKFSVRKQRGSAIRITWTDGPNRAQVDALVGGFAGGGFDGMTDSRYGITSWWKGEPVRFGADFIFTDRSLSTGYLHAILPRAAARAGVAVDAVETYDHADGTSTWCCRDANDQYHVGRALRRYSREATRASATFRHLGTHKETPGYAPTSG